MSLRSHIRNALVIVAIALTLPLWLPTLIAKHVLGSDGVFHFCTELLSLVPGKPGTLLRRGYYVLALDRCAWDCQIAFGTTFSHSRVEIHPHVVIGRNCLIGRAIIRRGVAIGSNVDILSGRRQHILDRTGVPVQYLAGHFTQLDIGANAWIGNSAVIMNDVGEGAVIGAGSVVVHGIAAYGTAVGNPAVVKKTRATVAEKRRVPALGRPPHRGAVDPGSEQRDDPVSASAPPS
jgi:acetyltransferase-like isoleucine patch superfamily enzyme